MQSNILRDYYDNNRCELSNRLLAQRQYLLVSSGFNCQCYKISRMTKMVKICYAEKAFDTTGTYGSLPAICDHFQY